MSPLACAEPRGFSLSRTSPGYLGGPRQRRHPHRYSLKERLSISGTDGGSDRSEVLGTEDINLVGHDDVGGAKTKG
jgi:hypothetical protein